ncbi:MAG: TolC family protein [Zoogloea sp.]|uniref:TolC family protein n=1 Tax=Zoogloea sp. TaxID=49181 RepID=UPI002631992C|nr:TolC family protein [Zoogloea sp.]MDD3329202.1 TolC family protein [Zoogloea sp.]
MLRKVLIAVALSAAALPALAAPGGDAVPASVQPGAAYSLQALREMARATHPSVAAAEAYVEAGRAQVTTAGAYPNPEVEFLAGRSRARMPGVVAGSAQSMALTQRLDNPWQRDARLDAARFGLEAREAERRGLQNELLARLDQRFFDVLRRQAELRASQEDLGIAEQIRSKVAVRVNTGESPRFELIKADTELLNAQKAAESASLRLAQARAALRGVVGPTLPADFQVDGGLAYSPAVPPLDDLRAEALARNPELLRSQAEVRRAERQLELERLRRQPDVALKVANERDRELNDTRLGVVVNVPIWDRRQGPVAEAAALLSRSRSEEASQRLALLQSLEGAYREYEIARTQVNALENGILREAESTMKVAEAAYRFGERGILEYLDAQRVFRAARNELIAARYALQLAVIEIERLRAPQ